MKNIKYIIIILLILLITGCGKNAVQNTKSVNDIVNEKMKSMTLEQKIAQMLVLYYTNDHVDDNLKSILNSYNPGGFILMNENITTYDKTKSFVSDLQKNSDIPMIISIDQEGGNVQKLQNISDVDVLSIPYMYDLGITKNEKLAYSVGKVMAEQLKTIGVNVVFAPVLDIYSNSNNTVIGNRSFGKNEKIVSKMAINLAKGLEDNGIIATYKHFPGHGDTSVDSHYSLPIINKSYKELKFEELKPFKNAIDNNAKIIMVGHLAIPSITKDNTPSSLSKKIVTDILKKDMNYEGLVITDALNMGALTNNFTYDEIYTKSIEAGVDLLLMPNGSKNAIDIIKNNISEERIDQSVKKILTFKYTYLKKYTLLDKEYLNNEEQRNIINKIINNK